MELSRNSKRSLVANVENVMFCPRCSQEQISAEIRYCSRCGLPLADVSEALDNGGFVDRNAAEHARGLRRSISIGILLMAASFIFFIVSLVVGTPEPSSIVQFNLFVTLVTFMLGLGWVGHSIWRKSKSVKPQGNVSGSSANVTLELPQPRVPELRGAYTQHVYVENTREFDQVPLVPENTTKFLKEEAE